MVLLAVLFSGVLPGAFNWFARQFGASAWSLAGFLFAIGIALSLPDLPLEWYSQFQLEQRFGFNTTTLRLWWMDRLKGLVLAVVLGYPLLVLLLKLVQWTGESWWFWGWAAVPEGSLRERLMRLAERTRFRARSVQVMDGSKRSRHSNAFFTGFGRFRKIVLFDTLIQQLAEPELEAVLAHEIGHFKRKHIPKTLALAAVSSLIGFWVIAWLAHQEGFYRSFGFEPGSIVPALLLFGLLSGVATFWLSPLLHWWSRRHEYEADAFAAAVMNESGSLIQALRKLNEKNLSNLTPHPLYSGFYYSHPALLERERALERPR
jgi:STE24 endopeptidase